MDIFGLKRNLMNYSLMHLLLWVGFPSYYGNSTFIIEVVFWILKVITINWVGSVSLVKATNLRFVWDILFIRVWDAIKSFLMGKTCDEHWKLMVYLVVLEKVRKHFHNCYKTTSSGCLYVWSMNMYVGVLCCNEAMMKTW
jgi:hypothetical protein